MKRRILLLAVLLEMTSAFSATDYYCTGCQGKLLRTDTFCPKCGAKISFASADRQNTTSSSSTRSPYYQSYSSKYPDVYFSLGFFCPAMLALTIPFDGYDFEARLNGVSLGIFVGGYQSVRGAQMDFLFNVCQGELKGFQLGVCNLVESADAHGVQIGWVNCVKKRLYGVQIGLLNFNQDGPIPFFPGINIGW